MLQLNFNPFPVLTTQRLVLRQISQGDVHEVFFLRSDEEMMKYIDRPRAKTLQEAADFIEKMNDAIKNNDAIAWALTLKGNNKLIGTIGLWQIDKQNYRSALGYALLPHYQGKGIMSEAIQGVINFAFNVINLHSIEANVNPENIVSANLLKRMGFVQEAYFRENYYFDGNFLDSAIYSLVKPK